MATPPAHAAIIDLETTAHTDEADPLASILEVGVVLAGATAELPILGEASLLIRPPGTLLDHDRLFAGMPQVVRDMHTTSGLWTDATTSDNAWRVDEAEQQLLHWLDSHGVTTAILMGSGVSHYDDRWLRRHMPRLFARLTYWSIDAGVIRRALELAGRTDLVDLVGDVDSKPHRALEDARLHLAETRRYLSLLRSLQAQPVA